jgi:hypothetical protein
MLNLLTDSTNGAQLYTSEYILSKLNKERLDYISFRFQNAQNHGFLKVEFMMMMSEIIPLHMSCDKSQEQKAQHQFNLYHGLFLLFQEIDMNEDGFLEWEEFSTYIVDVVGFEDLN